MTKTRFEKIAEDQRALQWDVEAHVYDLINLLISNIKPEALPELDALLASQGFVPFSNHDYYRTLSLNEFPHTLDAIKDDPSADWPHAYFSQHKYQYAALTPHQRKWFTCIKQSRLEELRDMTLTLSDLESKDASGFTLIDWAKVRHAEIALPLIFSKIKLIFAAENADSLHGHSLTYWGIQTQQVNSVEGLYNLMRDRKYALAAELISIDRSLLAAQIDDENSIYSVVIKNDDVESLEFLTAYEGMDYLALIQSAAHQSRLNVLAFLLSQSQTIISNIDNTALIANHPIHIAVKNSDKACYDVLISACPEMAGVRNESGYTPLMMAVKDHNLEMVKHILQQDRYMNAKVDSPKSSLDYGKTALQLAIDENQPRIMLELLDAGAVVNENFQIHGLAAATPCAYAIYVNQVKIVTTLLLSNKVQHEESMNCFEHAMHCDRREIAKLMSFCITDTEHATILARILEVDHVDAWHYFKEDFSAPAMQQMKYAILAKAKAIFEVLVDTYFDEVLSSFDELKQLVQVAALDQQLWAIHCLLKAAIQKMNSPNAAFMTPLSFAIKRGLTQAAVLLYQENPQQVDGNGLTPLMQAAKKNAESVELLISLGANVNDIVKESKQPRYIGKSALSFAIEFAKEAVITTLINHGISMKYALHEAAQKGYLSIVEKVFQEVNLEIKDEKGRTPLVIATMAGHRHIVRFLVSKGANKEAARAIAPLTLLDLLIARPQPAAEIAEPVVTTSTQQSSPISSANSESESEQKCVSQSSAVVISTLSEQLIVDDGKQEYNRLMTDLDSMLLTQPVISIRAKALLDDAIKKASVSKFIKVYRKYPEIKTAIIDNKTLLEYLIVENALECFNWYCREPGVEISGRAVACAISTNNLPRLKTLLKLKPSLLNALIYHRRTPLMLAVDHHHAEIVSWLLTLPDLDYSVKYYTDPAQPNPYQDGITAFAIACSQQLTHKPKHNLNSQTIVNMFLEESKVDVTETYTTFRLCPAHLASQAGNVDLLIDILNHEPEQVNAVCAEGITPLMQLVCSPVVNSKQLEKFIMWQYDREGRVIPLRKIDLDQQVEVIARPEWFGYTASHFAVLHRKPEALEILLAHGASDKIRADNGALPLELAVGACALDEIDVLYSHNPAAFKGEELVKQLTARYEASNNPMPLPHRCIYQEDFSLLKLLIENRPSLMTLVDENGLTPLEFARELAFCEIKGQQRRNNATALFSSLINYEEKRLNYFECYLYIVRLPMVSKIVDAINNDHLASAQETISTYPDLALLKTSLGDTLGVYAAKKGRKEIARAIFAATIGKITLKQMYERDKVILNEREHPSLR